MNEKVEIVQEVHPLRSLLNPFVLIDMGLLNTQSRTKEMFKLLAAVFFKSCTF